MTDFSSKGVDTPVIKQICWCWVVPFSLSSEQKGLVGHEVRSH